MGVEGEERSWGRGTGGEALPASLLIISGKDSSDTVTPWVRLGERAQVRGTIQWDRPLLLPLGANTFLEVANREEALAWYGHEFTLEGEPRLAETTPIGEGKPEEEVDIREELTAEDVKLFESKAQGARRIAHVPTSGRDWLQEDSTISTIVATTTPTTTTTTTNTAAILANTNISTDSEAGSSNSQYRESPSNHGTLRSKVQEEKVPSRPIVLDSLVRERQSTLARGSPTKGPAFPSKGSTPSSSSPPTRPSLFKQSRRPCE